MTKPKIVSRGEWLKARRELLQKEKELTVQRDKLSGERRELPWVAVEKDYVFESLAGRRDLRELFGPHDQLIVYHFMFDPEWEEGCLGCSHVMDGIAGSIVHLGARNTAFAAVSRAPLAKSEPFRKRMGWEVQWVSSAGNEFNYDFQVTLDPDRPENLYNFESVTTLHKKGKLSTVKGEMPGLSVFIKHEEQIYHTYSLYQRGLDQFLNSYNLLDHTPLGRQENGKGMGSWVRHHDRY